MRPSWRALPTLLITSGHKSTVVIVGTYLDLAVTVAPQVVRCTL